METLHGYLLTGEWKNGQKGQTISAERGGKRYFIKKYTRYVLPSYDGMFDEKTIAQKKKDFEEFTEFRKKIVAVLKPIGGPGGNLIIPCDCFVEGHHYYEATEFVEGAIKDEELEDFLKDLPMDTKKMMMMTAAGALSGVHAQNVVHSDLKLKNIMVVKNASGRLVAKLIDFDSSYFIDDRRYIGGDDVYCSPELAEYSNTEDEEERAALRKKISEKTDVFSLGVVFHFYLTGTFPTAKELSPYMKKVKAAKEKRGQKAVFYVSTILLEGCELVLSESIKSPKLRSLILDMLQRDPDKRPSAMQVLKRLKEGEPIIADPWEEHHLVLDKGALAKDGIVGFRPVAVEGVKQYEVLYSSGKRAHFTKEELASHGYVSETVSGFEEPWEEHAIAFDVERLASRNFVAGKRCLSGSVKGYRLYRPDGSTGFYTVEKLLAVSYAKRYIAPVKGSFEEPWPEHGIELLPEMIKAKGYIGCQRQSKGGFNGYLFKTSSGIERFMRVEMVIVQKMARKI